jgi:hypothetical protein
MDRLLRRYARLKGETLRADGEASNNAARETVSGAHLDADEMNAYAEGALPEAARSRYFAHLADCDSCRKLVTDLTLAASLADEGKARVASLETTPQKSWHEWLAALFSPPVLRYGVPALALFAVIIVAIVATRMQRRESSIAQNKTESGYSAPAIPMETNSATGNVTVPGTAGSHSNSNVAPLAAEQSPAQPGVAATPLPPAKPEVFKDSAPVVSPDTVAKSAATPSGNTRDSSGEFGVAGKREQRETADAPPPPAPQPAGSTVTAVTEADKQNEAKKAKDAGRDDADEISIDGRTAGGVFNQAKPKEDRPNLGAASTTSRAARGEMRRKASPAAKTGPPSDNKVAEEERQERSAETQSVGGRHFRRQGNAWIDTAYKSSSLVNVARGSEQYRALVADESALRKIAEHFGGEVIVVWKGRAYRFY